MMRSIEMVRIEDQVVMVGRGEQKMQELLVSSSSLEHVMCQEYVR